MADQKHSSVPSLPSDLLRSTNIRRAAFVRLGDTTRRIRRFFGIPQPFSKSPFTNSVPKTTGFVPSSMSQRTRRGLSFSFPKRKRKRRRMNDGVLALRKVRKLEKKVEVKMHDIDFNTLVNVGTAGVVTNLASIAQGDTISSRDAETIFPQSFDLRLIWNGDVAEISGVYRTIIFQDMRQVVSTPTPVLTLLKEATSLSQYSLANRKRFRIYYDETFTLDGNAADHAQLHTRHVVRKVSRSIQWTGATSTAWTKDGLFMVNITNLAANQPNFSFTFRLFFTD